MVWRRLFHTRTVARVDGTRYRVTSQWHDRWGITCTSLVCRGRYGVTTGLYGGHQVRYAGTYRNKYNLRLSCALGATCTLIVFVLVVYSSNQPPTSRQTTAANGRARSALNDYDKSHCSSAWARLSTVLYCTGTLPTGQNLTEVSISARWHATGRSQQS